MLQQELMKGVTVVELANVLAGPAVGMFFAELGAQVIKIENKLTQGDITRQWKLPTEPAQQSYSAYYCSTNWGKETHLLDLNIPEELNQVMQWIAKADIVISNFRKEAAQKFGLDAAQLRQQYPKLIYAQLTAFGESDPTPAFDVVLQAETGFLFMTGEPKGNPVKMPVALIDLLAAHQLKEGILLAYIHRLRTGKGATVKTSLLKSGISSLANQATNWLMAGHIPQRMGCQHPNIAPYGDLFITRDQKSIVLAVGTEKQFRQLCAVLDLVALPKQSLFATNTARVQNRSLLVQILQTRIESYLCADLFPLLHQNGIPAGQIRNTKEVFERSEVQDMILTEKMDDGKVSHRVATISFEILG